MPPLSTHLHIYCERGYNDLLTGEPINAISNIGFFIAGLMLLHLYHRQKPISGNMPEVLMLIALTFIVGTGSFIFHTVGTMGAALFDVIPIAIFILYFVYIFSRCVLGFNRPRAWGMLAALAAVNIVFKYFVFRATDGYVSYIPSFIFLSLIAVYLRKQRHPSTAAVFIATALAFVSLACRTIDRDICGVFPTGTHFLWHGFNAIVMYILVKEVIIHRTRAYDHR